jgi:hypothetical protein
MPDGLRFTDNGNGTATISGTAPTSEGIYNINIFVDSSSEVTQAFIVGIGEADFTSPSQVVVGEGHRLHFHVVATGTPRPSIQPYGFPSWVKLGGPGGALLSGLAPQGSVGSYPCALTATYEQGFNTENFTVDVLGFTSAAAVSFTDGEPGSFKPETYSLQITAKSGGAKIRQTLRLPCHCKHRRRSTPELDTPWVNSPRGRKSRMAIGTADNVRGL